MISLCCGPARDPPYLATKVATQCPAERVICAARRIVRWTAVRRPNADDRARPRCITMLLGKYLCINNAHSADVSYHPGSLYFRSALERSASCRMGVHHRLKCSKSGMVSLYPRGVWPKSCGRY